MKILVVMIVALILTGCTDGMKAKFDSFGDSRSIICYSGGIKIYEGESTGKISSEQNSDGYYFVEKGTGKLLEVSGNCVLGK